MSAGPPGVPLPAASRLLIGGVAVTGGISIGAAVWALPLAFPEGGLRSLWIPLLLVTVLVGIELRPPTLRWRGQRVAIVPDEAVLLFALAILHWHQAILVALAASLTVQAFLRRPLAKAVFNVGLDSFAVAAAGAAYQSLLLAGAHPLAAALAIPPVVSLATHVPLAALFASLEGERVRSTWTLSLARNILLSAGVGASLGASALVLYAAHPALPFLVFPLAYILYRTVAMELRHERELQARRALSTVSERLAGRAGADEIAEAAFAACREIFSLHDMTLRVRQPNGTPREWRFTLPGPAPPRCSSLTAPIRCPERYVTGELTFTLDARGRPPTEADEELARLVGAYVGIALDSIFSLQALEDARERLRRVFHAAKDPMLILGADGRIVYRNAAAASLLPTREGEGGRFEAALDEESRARFLEATEQPAFHPTVEVSTPGGSTRSRTLELSMSRMRLEEGERGLLILGRDLTDRRRLETEAERQRLVIARQEQLSALGTLVAGVAHEINNPLMYMRGNIEIALLDVSGLSEDLAGKGVQPRQDPAEVGHNLKQTLAGIDRISRITKSLKAVARKGTGARERVDLNEIVENVAELVAMGMPDRVTLKIEADASVPPVHVCPEEIHQVLLNLVKNAVEAAMEGGGIVRITTTAERDRVLLRVIDNGPGISPEARLKLFHPFFTTKSDGTGLGLPIASSIVREHGGQIDVTEAPGGGTAFTVRLPLPRATPETAPLEGPGTPRSTSPPPAIRPRTP